MEFDRILTWMEPWIDTSFVPSPIDVEVGREAVAAAGRSEAMYERLLTRWNGFYALGGLLHVFGACTTPPNHSLREWNRPDGWRASWGRLTEGLMCFAEDAFGNQFAFRGGKIVRFRAVAGGIQPMQATLDEWLEAVLLEPEYALNESVFRACVERLGALPRGGHFASAVPPRDDGTIDPATAQIVPARDSMEAKALTAQRVMRRSSQFKIPKS